MQLLLDIQGAQSPDHGERGIARYVMEHAEALYRSGDDVAGLLLQPGLPLPGHLNPGLLGAPELTWNTATNVAGKVSEAGNAAYLIMSPFEFRITCPMLPAHIATSGMPVVATLYDLVPLIDADRYLNPDVAGRYHRRLELLRSASLVLAISEYTRQDGIRLADLDPDRVVTIGSGVSPFFQPPHSRRMAFGLAQRALPAIRRPYLLCISDADDRKNTDRLISAYARLPADLRERHQLVLVGKANPRRWLTRAREEGLAPGDVVLTGFITDEVMRLLYQATSLFVFPSLYEGFGLPPAEALACGAPVITSNTSSLPEVLEFPDATFDPISLTDMTRRMEAVLTHDRLAERLRSVGAVRRGQLTWDRVAARTREALLRITPAPPPRLTVPAVTRRLRIGLVGPMPPTVSDIATYNGHLVPELIRHADVDVFFPSTEPVWRGRPDGVGAYPIPALGTLLNAHSYDALVYTAGNDVDQQRESHEAMQQYPGIVWFHDVRFPLFVRQYAEDGHMVLAERLRRFYGPRGTVILETGWNARSQARFGVGFTRDWVLNSRGAIVHSPLARQLLTLDQGPDAMLPPTWHLPRACPAVPGGRVERVMPPVIGTFGRASPVAVPPELIDAVAHLRATGVMATIAVVGRCHHAQADDLRRRAAQLGMRGALVLTGEVAETEYQSWMRRVTCAVQLRRGTNEESPAPIADALAMGLPTLTNRVGAGREFAPESVVVIEPDADARALSSVLLPLLSDASAWERASSAAWHHAVGNDFAGLASRLAAVVGEVATHPASLQPEALPGPGTAGALGHVERGER